MFNADRVTRSCASSTGASEEDVVDASPFVVEAHGSDGTLVDAEGAFASRSDS